MLPNEIIDSQRVWRQENTGHSSEGIDESTFLFFYISNSAFLLPISEVKEISEILPIRQYPVEVDGHKGVISLRGKVIPVISMSCFVDQGNSKINSRIVFINAHEDIFAIVVDTVKKVSLKVFPTHNIVTLEDRPVQVLSAEQILSMWKKNGALRGEIHGEVQG